jgi:3-phenylpropionate/trans-cinnamate dioxygenase ferredoxin component
MSNLAADGFIAVAKLDEFKSEHALVREVSDRLVLLIMAGDHVYCLDDVCTHDGGTLSDGHIEDQCIVCPRHGAKFDYRTGAALTMPATEATVAHQVQVHDDTVYVKLSDS